MKKLLITVLIPLCGYAAVAQTKHKPAVKKSTKATSSTLKPTNLLDSASYAFGLSMASSLKGSGLKTLNYELMVKGLKDAFAGNPPLMSQEASQKAIESLFKTVSQSKFSANIAEGKNFLENNKKNPGVKTTASGLQYLVITPGSGPKPAVTDTVLVNYKGMLLSGKQFDSSYDRNEPLSLSLDRVIPGWTEGMQLMSPGAKYKFFIPYNLAYGERGAGQDIPPYSTLVFEIELLKVNGK
ncbi:FKBP-type peptidyl-prolyl cis-trans isomerase [Pedobacter sp. L105]|uniref:FKBP-type peptidyl-prolyl cis-trans isomerase n=1 Tax=Pedobacter sp. L105 TaxID=1641871 RepID=UPI00131CFFE1|nr:FKBP-type peptidyl-prolyl cis-trans isomerase [Pedobacter sp. L105]